MAKRQTLKDKLRERINKEFKEQLMYPIPLDQPIETHTRAEVKVSQCLAWYFVPKLDMNATKEESVIDEECSLIGSDYTIKELLDAEEWELVLDKKEDQFPEGSMKIKIV